MKGENIEKAKLLKSSLKIIDELGNLDISDDLDEIDDLIDKAKKLKKNRYWKL